MRRRSLVMTFVAAAATVGLAAPQLANSAPTQDPRAQREQVRAEKAEVAARIDTSEASLAEIDAALQTLEDNLRTQQGALTRTEAQVVQANQDIADAEAAIAKLTDEVAVLTKEMRRRAVLAYVSPPGDDVLTVLETNDFTTASTRKFYIELRAQKDADVADRLNGAASDLAYQKRKATDAKALADTKQAEQKKRTRAVAAAEADQQQISDNLEATIDSEVARSIRLSKTDRALSAKIAKQQAALVARLAAQKAAKEEADKKTAADAAARKAEQKRIRDQAAADNEAADGKESAPAEPRRPTETTTTTTTTTAPPVRVPSTKAARPPVTTTPVTTAPVTTPPVTTAPVTPPDNGGPPDTGGGGAVVEPGPIDSGVQLAYVQGIPVNAQVAQQVTDMINAASADGVSLQIGNSYRSVSLQIELRKQNCGTSSYAIYEMSSGSCSPPTAKPGQSQHQLGLAIDFSNCSSSSPCHRWLAANASRYGYFNLPSESWHWSTTGT